MKQLLIIGLILGLTNCLVSQDKLADNKTFRKTFSKAEIQDLQLLFDFFNESICSDSEKQDLTKCYQDFFTRMEKSHETGDIQLNIPFDKQQEIYEQFSDSTFFEIWNYGISYRHRDAPLDTFRNVYLALDGKYLDFLKKTGRKDRVIENYYESVVAVEDIPPSIIAGLLVNHKYYDIEDLRVKFIVAIHYLTLNDHFERKEKINKNSG